MTHRQVLICTVDSLSTCSSQDRFDVTRFTRDKVDADKMVSCEEQTRATDAVGWTRPWKGTCCWTRKERIWQTRQIKSHLSLTLELLHNCQRSILNAHCVVRFGVSYVEAGRSKRNGTCLGSLERSVSFPFLFLSNSSFEGLDSKLVSKVWQVHPKEIKI